MLLTPKIGITANQLNVRVHPLLSSFPPWDVVFSSIKLPIVLTAWGNFTSSYFRTAQGAGLRGSTTCWIGVVFHADDAFFSPDYLMGNGATTTSEGVHLRIDHQAGGGSAAALARDVDSVEISSQSFAAAGSILGYTHAVIFWYDDPDLKISLDDQTPSTLTTDGGYAPPGATQRMHVGTGGAGSSPYGYGRVLGVVGGDSAVPTVGEVSSWFAAIKGGDPAPIISGKTDHRWVGGSTSDTVGSDNLELVGAGVPETQLTTKFAW